MKKKTLHFFTLLTICLSLVFGLTAFADDDKKPTKVKASGKQSRTIYVGSEFKLKVKANGDDDDLRWYITGKKGIVAFEDNDRDDDDIELHALKKGSTKVTCRIKGTKKSVTFKISVKKPKYKSKSQKIARYGAATVTVPLGDDKDLKVRKASKVKDNYLKWTITGKSGIVTFDDDIYDNDIEIEGRRVGTTKVTCTHLLTGQKVSYNVIVKDYDDDKNDDDDDDDKNDDDDDDDDDDKNDDDDDDDKNDDNDDDDDKNDDDDDDDDKNDDDDDDDDDDKNDDDDDDDDRDDD